ncbi:hypothetical protein IEQ34_015710 [Dendrobium chrysotoxum]|uniref:Ubiquitin-like protease family profile domain-containing protein n=1 Tax=Dendrobium chrysotoxum TaxID=161865 RepID=A0AAV7GJ69_DENCH|nr:hypothetical protein IEQ34_015710 [Dendrobium chrysotoxum]
MPYQKPVTSRCYVTTFRKICDAFAEIIDDEVEQTFRNLKIYQFLKFPAFQQCIPLLFEILKFWNAADEGFVVNCHLFKFTSDEVSLLTGLPNIGDEIKWKIWFLEHFSCNKSSNLDSRPHFLRWEGNTNMYYTQDSATKLFKFSKNNEKAHLKRNNSTTKSNWNVTDEEVEQLGADLNALQNRDIRPDMDDVIFQTGNIAYRDKVGAFPSDIITWKLQTVRGIPTQSNDYDCGIFKMDWASLKDWQKYMIKFRAKLGYALCPTIKL